MGCAKSYAIKCFDAHAMLFPLPLLSGFLYRSDALTIDMLQFECLVNFQADFQQRRVVSWRIEVTIDDVSTV